MTNLAEIGEELDRAVRLIGAARETVDGGNVVDLTGLDEIVQQACARIETLSEEDRATVKPLLMSLIASLNGLVGVMETQHREMAGEIEHLSSRSRATSAYGRGAATGRGNRDT
jgi:hypothetical protein